MTYSCSITKVPDILSQYWFYHWMKSSPQSNIVHVKSSEKYECQRCTNQVSLECQECCAKYRNDVNVDESMRLLLEDMSPSSQKVGSGETGNGVAKPIKKSKAKVISNSTSRLRDYFNSMSTNNTSGGKVGKMKH